MRQQLIRGYYLFRASVYLSQRFLYAYWYFRVKALNDVALPAGQGWPARDRRRWEHYFYGTTYLAALFGALCGRRRNRTEIQLFAQLSALAGLFDDLTDVYRPNNGADRAPEHYGLAVDPSGRTGHLLAAIQEKLPAGCRVDFRQYMLRVFEVETAGRQRHDVAPEWAELARLTAEKGGCSVLLFRALLATPLPPGEREALYAFGALIQLCDDIFDLWFDRQAQTVTLVTVLTEQGELEHLCQLFETQVAATIRAFRATAYPPARIEMALGVLHFLVSITRLCLQHYQRLAARRGGLPFDERAALVLDMDRWRNRWRAARLLLETGWNGDNQNR